MEPQPPGQLRVGEVGAAEAELTARVVEIDASNCKITTHDDSIAAIGAFLGAS
jgi:hypothetical protein